MKHKKTAMNIMAPSELDSEIMRRSQSMGISKTRYVVAALTAFVASGATVSITEEQAAKEEGRG